MRPGSAEPGPAIIRRAKRVGLQVRPGALVGGCGAWWELVAHVLELLAGGHLLGEEGGLDAVEQALEPADELGLGQAQLDVARDLGLVEGQGQPIELLAQVG